MWTEQEAKEKLDQLLQRAEAGEPQVIGANEPCVVITLAEYERLTRRGNGGHLGKWLIENAPRIGDIDLPPRHSDRPVPFDDWTEEELAG
jgi:prevent-host-death family protein